MERYEGFDDNTTIDVVYYSFIDSLKSEVKYIPSLSNNPIINSKMRFLLIEWLFQVTIKLKLYHDTWQLCNNILDRFMNTVEGSKINVNQYQLVGVCCLMIATKFEEEEHPTVHQFLYSCNDSYNKEEFLKMEKIIITSIGYRLHYTPGIYYLRYLTKFYDYSIPIMTCGKYLVNLCYLYGIASRYKGSKIVSATILLSTIFLSTSKNAIEITVEEMIEIIKDHLNYEIDDYIKIIYELFLTIYDNIINKKKNSVYELFSTNRFFQMSIHFPLFSTFIRMMKKEVLNYILKIFLLLFR